MKNTIKLHDCNMSGYILYLTEDTPEVEAEWLAQRSGLWTDYGGTSNGMLLTSSEWSADYFAGVELTEEDIEQGHAPYPNYRLEGTNSEPYWQCEEA